MKAHDFDKAFDNGEDVVDVLDVANASRPNRDVRRVNVDFPAWMLDELDKEAARLGINRQAVIKTWIARILESRPVA